jgi:hypothetical protein
VVLLAVSDHQGFWYFEYQISVYSLKYELGRVDLLPALSFSSAHTASLHHEAEKQVLPPHV